MSDQLQQYVVNAITSSDVLTGNLIFALILASIVSCFKVIAPDKWMKLGPIRVFIAPLLMLVTVLLTIHPMSLKNLILVFTSGFGATIVHEVQTSFQEFAHMAGVRLPFGDFFVCMNQQAEAAGIPASSPTAVIKAADPICVPVATAPAATDPSQPPASS